MEHATRQALRNLLELAESELDFNDNWEAWAIARQDVKIALQEDESEVAVKSFFHWLKDQDLNFVQINSDGSHIFLSPPFVLGSYLFQEDITNGSLTIGERKFRSSNTGRTDHKRLDRPKP